MPKYNVKYEFEYEYNAETPEHAIELFFEHVYDSLIEAHELDRLVEVTEL